MIPVEKKLTKSLYPLYFSLFCGVIIWSGKRVVEEEQGTAVHRKNFPSVRDLSISRLQAGTDDTKPSNFSARKHQVCLHVLTKAEHVYLDCKQGLHSSLLSHTVRRPECTKKNDPKPAREKRRRLQVSSFTFKQGSYGRLEICAVIF